MELVELFKGVELFAGLDHGQLEQLARISHMEEFQDGDLVVSKGEQGSSLYIIRDGQFGVMLEASPVKETSVYLGAGQIFGEMALLDYGERSATIRCVSQKATLAVLSREDFERLCQADTAIGYVVMRNMATDLSFKLRHRNLEA